MIAFYFYGIPVISAGFKYTAIIYNRRFGLTGAMCSHWRNVFPSKTIVIYRNDHWITCANQICRIVSGFRITKAQLLTPHAHWYNKQHAAVCITSVFTPG